MKLKKLLSIGILMSIPTFLFFISCKKEPQNTKEELKLKGKDFRTKVMSGSCSGSETNQTRWTVEIYHDNDTLTGLRVTEQIEYYCDGLLLSTYRRLMEREEFWVQVDTSQYNVPGPQASYTTCSTNRFDVNNILHFNPGLRQMDRSVLEQIYAKVQNYHDYDYNGSYVLADLNTYGYGSNDKLIYATFGYLASSVLGSVKAKEAFNNVPSTYGGSYQPCDFSIYQNAAVAGANYFSSHYEASSDILTLQQAFAYYLDRIASHTL